MTAPASAARRPVEFFAVDNHESVLESFAILASRYPSELRCVGRSTTVEAVPWETPAPDVVVLDLYLGRDDEPSTPWIPRLIAWGARVLLYTSAEFPIPVRQAVAAGAAGLTLKNDGLDSLRLAVLDVADGEFACSSTVAHALVTDPSAAASLSPRELDVVRGLDDGLTYQQIARRFKIATDTVKDHLKSVRAKYVALDRPITNSHSIIREARRDGWLDDRRGG
jgi:DNA-binding NarL/FixJ family response regulator